MKKTITSFLIITSLTACNNEELEKLKNDNLALKTELDSLKVFFKKQEDKKNFYGKYINTEKSLYKSFNFKGETSVVITDGIFGIPFATGYVRDGQILRIQTDKTDLMLTIKDNKTLIGEGFAEGIYVKTE